MGAFIRGFFILILSSNFKIDNIAFLGYPIMLFPIFYFNDYWINDIEPKLISLLGFRLFYIQEAKKVF